jgi:hypothetical protein
MAKLGIHMVLDEGEAQAVQLIKTNYNIPTTRDAVKASLHYLAYGEKPPLVEDNPDLEDVWVPMTEAIRILTENSGHSIHRTYLAGPRVRGEVRRKAQNNRTYLYNARDLSRIHVKRRTEPPKETVTE